MLMSVLSVHIIAMQMLHVQIQKAYLHVSVMKDIVVMAPIVKVRIWLKVS